MNALSEWDRGVAAYRTGQRWDSTADEDWRRGWIAAQHQRRDQRACEHRMRQKKRLSELRKPMADDREART